MSRQGLLASIVAAPLFAAALLGSLSLGCDCGDEDAYNTHGGPSSEGPATLKSPCEEVGGTANPVFCPTQCTAGGTCSEGYACDSETGWCNHGSVEHCMTCAQSPR